MFFFLFRWRLTNKQQSIILQQRHHHRKQLALERENKPKYYSIYFNDNGKKFGHLFLKQTNKLNKRMILAIYFALAVTSQNTLASQKRLSLHRIVWLLCVNFYFFLSLSSLLSFAFQCCVQLLHFECLQWTTPITIAVD